jgi:heme oxygenase (mycobilin-producing)
MKIYFTSGTENYLTALIEEYPKEVLVLMQNETSCLLIHETEEDSLFKEPRKYEVVSSSGPLMIPTALAVFHHIPVTEEGRPLFEYYFKNIIVALEQEQGFKAIRVCRPFSSDTYVILTLWTNAEAFRQSTIASSFKDAYVKGQKTEEAHKKIRISSRPSFMTKYYIV